jgi:hypothetical protein
MLGRLIAQEGPMTTVWIYVDTSKEVGDVDHLKVLRRWSLLMSGSLRTIRKGVAFGYEVE